MIKYERERKCTPGMLRSSFYYRGKRKVHKAEKKSVYGVRPVTYLVNDGFLKPTDLSAEAICFVSALLLCMKRAWV